jgi:acetyl esterase/lipase
VKNKAKFTLAIILTIILTGCSSPAEIETNNSPSETAPPNTVTITPANPETNNTEEEASPAATEPSPKAQSETNGPAPTPNSSETINTPTGITIQTNIPYTTTATTLNGTTTLTLDLYSPTDTNGKPLIKNQPAVLLIHGGAFITGSKNLTYMETWASALAKEGYVVANINYRLLLQNPTPTNQNLITYLNNADPTSALPTQAPPEAISALRIGLAVAIEDANTALTWLTQQGVNPNKIAIAGESAGAITALHLAYLNDTLKLNPITPTAIINIYGAMSKPTNGGTAINKNEPPLWTIHGTADQVVPYTAAEYLDQQTRTANIPHTLHTIQNAGHGMTQIGYLTNKTNDGTTYLEDSVNFLNTHLKR